MVTVTDRVTPLFDIHNRILVEESQFRLNLKEALNGLTGQAEPELKEIIVNTLRNSISLSSETERDNLVGVVGKSKVEDLRLRLKLEFTDKIRQNTELFEFERLIFEDCRLVYSVSEFYRVEFIPVLLENGGSFSLLELDFDNSVKVLKVKKDKYDNIWHYLGQNMFTECRFEEENIDLAKIIDCLRVFTSHLVKQVVLPNIAVLLQKNFPQLKTEINRANLQLDVTDREPICTLKWVDSFGISVTRHSELLINEPLPVFNAFPSTQLYPYQVNLCPVIDQIIKENNLKKLFSVYSALVQDKYDFLEITFKFSSTIDVLLENRVVDEIYYDFEGNIKSNLIKNFNLQTFSSELTLALLSSIYRINLKISNQTLQIPLFSHSSSQIYMEAFQINSQFALNLVLLKQKQVKTIKLMHFTTQALVRADIHSLIKTCKHFSNTQASFLMKIVGSPECSVDLRSLSLLIPIKSAKIDKIVATSHKYTFFLAETVKKLRGKSSLTKAFLIDDTTIFYDPKANAVIFEQKTVYLKEDKSIYEYFTHFVPRTLELLSKFMCLPEFDGIWLKRRHSQSSLQELHLVSNKSDDSAILSRIQWQT